MKNYKALQIHYENCLKKHGPNAKGMDWPNAEDLNKRFKVLTDIIFNYSHSVGEKLNIIDLGCGIGLLVDYLTDSKLMDLINYRGIDISPVMIEFASQRLPQFKFEERDILTNRLKENETDYIIMNGLFTEKRELSHTQMFDFFTQMITETYTSARKGIAFNVMSTQVDWRRDDLFHLGLDELAEFVTKRLTRNIIIRMDYGLYEYSVYIKK
jgi:SAM-dependent methyltransferase